jgi:hypothetical protein
MRVCGTYVCVYIYIYIYYIYIFFICVYVYARIARITRADINFSRSRNAHARGHGRHASALGETLRPDPRSFLSPRFSVPRHPRVAQARTAFRISEGRATRTREGALLLGWWKRRGYQRRRRWGERTEHRGANGSRCGRWRTTAYAYVGERQCSQCAHEPVTRPD